MKQRRMALFRAVSMAALGVALAVTVDLMLNYQASLMIVDGSISCTSVLHGLFGIFGDSCWSQQRFYQAYAASAWVTLALALENLALGVWVLLKQK